MYAATTKTTLKKHDIASCYDDIKQKQVKCYYLLSSNTRKFEELCDESQTLGLQR